MDGGADRRRGRRAVHRAPRHRARVAARPDRDGADARMDRAERAGQAQGDLLRGDGLVHQSRALGGRTRHEVPEPDLHRRPRGQGPGDRRDQGTRGLQPARRSADHHDGARPRRADARHSLRQDDPVPERVTTRVSSGAMPQSADLPKSRDLGQLRRLAGFLAPYRWRIAGALCALVLAAGSVLALGQGLKHVIDAGFASGDPRLLNRALAGIVGVAIVMSAATWFRFYLMMTTGERVITDIRRAVYGHLLSLEPAFFESARTGEVILRLTNDTAQLQIVVGYGFSMFLRNALMGLGALIMLVATSGKLAALVV